MKYVLTFIDQATRYSWIYLLPSKHSNLIVEKFKAWQSIVEKNSNTKVKILRTNQGKEYTAAMTKYLRNQGIKYEITSPYSSSLNGIVERLNRTLFDMVRPILITSSLPTSFWAEAIDTANKIWNRLPTKIFGDISPHEKYFNFKPTIKHLQPFRCIAYVKILTPLIPKGNKTAPRSIEGCLIGYIGNSIYRVWNPQKQTVETTSHIKFNPRKLFDKSVFSNMLNSQSLLDIPLDDLIDDATIDNINVDKYKAPIHPPMPQYYPAQTRQFHKYDLDSSDEDNYNKYLCQRVPIPRIPLPLLVTPEPEIEDEQTLTTPIIQCQQLEEIIEDIYGDDMQNIPTQEHEQQIDVTVESETENRPLRRSQRHKRPMQKV